MARRRQGHEASGRNTVQSVERVIGLFEALGRAGRPLSVHELSTTVGIPRPTVYRLLRTLTGHGFAVLTDGGFTIGPRILALAAQRLDQIELRTVGRGFLEDLRDHTGETVHLAVLEQGQVVYVDKLESAGPLRMASAVGRITPAHSTALGKAMLAHMPVSTVQQILQARGLPQRTANTITDPVRFMDELAAVRNRGFAIDNAENEEGIRCVGAAIFDHVGRVAGGVSLSGATSSITLERARRDLGPRVREIARAISRALEWIEAQGSAEE